MPTDTLALEPLRVEAPVSYPATFEAWLALPEGAPAQYVDGHIHMTPAPLLSHQDVVLNFYTLLRAYAIAHGGYAAVAPVDVYLEERLVVQPDVLYVAADRRDRLSERGVIGAPTLVAEVLSPSTAHLDLGRKRRAYEEAGVLEYWIFDRHVQTVDVLTATDAGLRTSARVYDEGTVASAVLTGFEVELADVFARP